MKILQLIPTYKPAYVYGGPIFSVSKLCETLAAEGHEVRMLTTTANGPDELRVPTGKKVMVDGVEVFYYRRFTKDHTHLSPGLIWAVWHQCRRYDAVHIHAWWNIPVLMAVLVCWLRGVRPVLSPRGMLSDFSFGKSNPLSKRLIHKFGGAFLLRKVKMHLTAEAERQEVERLGYPGGVVIPNIIDQATVPGSPLPRNHPPELLFLSRIHPKKNLELLFQSLAEVPHDWRLNIAGDGEEAYISALQKLAAELGIAERINWLGHLSGEQKFDYYRKADLFVLTSHNENFANVVIEALSAGTPVLLTKGVGLSDYVSNNDLGWVCEANKDAVKSSLEEFFSRPELARSFAAKARQTVERDFSAKALIPRYLELYAQS
ncbi:MAG: glycosyltransferase [Saprospiraceae bacterium]